MKPVRDLLLTAKNDRRVEFYDGSTHALLAGLDMPAPVHELALSADGCNHDDAEVFELDLVQGTVADRFRTGRGSEYVQYFDRA